MQLKTAKEIWDKIIQSYEGDSQVKRVKLLEADVGVFMGHIGVGSCRSVYLKF